MTFEEFAKKVDLHSLSHRGLNRELIPKWLNTAQRDLDGKISSSAYGQTPLIIQEQVIQLLKLQADDVFLDLGAGGGGVMVSVLEQGISAFGIEQNPLLVEAGRCFLESRGFAGERLTLGDFLDCDWPTVSKLYAATSRFSDTTMAGLIRRVQETTSIRRVVTLGREPVFSKDWIQQTRMERGVAWNPDEVELVEQLSSWERR